MSEQDAPAQLPEEEHLKEGALGFGSALVIGLASVAPAYSLAAVIGILAFDSGLQAPAVLILSFIPMLLVATGYYYMNRADPDCGTTFAWATRALGPTTGWLAGWAIMTAGIIVIGLLANTAATYFFYLFGWDSAVANKEAVVGLSVVFIGIATWLCVRGIEISARTQNILIVAQISALVIFAVVALFRVLTNDGIETSVDPSLSWFNPFEIASTDALVFGILTGIFIYWGWDSAVTVNEESEDSSHGPGKAAVLSTVILVALYLLVATACIAWLGIEALGEFEDETAFNAIAGGVFAFPLDRLVILAVLTSSLAATQTTVLPSSRTALSMGRRGAAPKQLAHIHHRYLTPDVATWIVGALAVAFYVIFNYTSETFYEASLSALGLLICINYGLNGISAAIYYRREIFKSAKNFFFLGLAPLVGATILGAVFVKSVYDFFQKGEDATYWFGVQAPLVVTIMLFIVAAAIIVGWRTTQAGRGFFARKRETADPALLAPAPAPEGRA